MTPPSTTPLWRPSEERVAGTNVTRFMEAVEDDWKVTVRDFAELHSFSMAEPEKFWVSLKDFVGVVAETWGQLVLVDGERMPGARWFPDARLNFAENLMRRQGDGDAIVFWGEDRVRTRLSHAELQAQVSPSRPGPGRRRRRRRRPGWRLPAEHARRRRCHARRHQPRRRVVVVLAGLRRRRGARPLRPDRAQGAVRRRRLPLCGKTHDSLDKIGRIAARLPSVECTLVIPYTRAEPPLDGIAGGRLLADFVAGFAAGEIAFRRLPFKHPLYILYSSGTTGVPKCIVHGAGGTLLQHMKEQILHCDVRPGDRVFYFTTCGWMMWNWLASMLSAQATLLLYDGAPFHPDGNVLFDLADAESMTLFGTSAKFIDALAKAGLEPARTHKLEHLRADHFDGLAAGAGGLRFRVREDQGRRAPGVDLGRHRHRRLFRRRRPDGAGVARRDPDADAGAWRSRSSTRTARPLRGEPGELVCSAPFPSMPVSFWNDPGDAKMRAAYFEKFPGVWCHGDYVATTEHGGMVIYGRSDATLNPGGVRIGTAEIYRQVEQVDEVVEAIVIGQEWDGDRRVVLFVVLRRGLGLDDGLIERIRTPIRTSCSPHHVPARVVQVADIPRTRSGKITELAVRDVVHGRPVKNKEALANPEALELYRDVPELRT